MAVTQDKKTGRWIVRIQRDGKRVRYGSYETIEEAQLMHLSVTESELSRVKLYPIEVNSGPVRITLVDKLWDKVLDWQSKRRQKRFARRADKMVADKIESDL